MKKVIIHNSKSFMKALGCEVPISGFENWVLDFFFMYYSFQIHCTMLVVNRIIRLTVIQKIIELFLNLVD